MVRTYLQHLAFDPSWEFTRRFTWLRRHFVTWEALRDLDSGRVNGWIEYLARETRHKDYRFLRIGHRGASGHAPDNPP